MLLPETGNAAGAVGEYETGKVADMGYFILANAGEAVLEHAIVRVPTGRQAFVDDKFHERRA